MMAVRAPRGAAITILRIRARIKPDCSARPTPIIATMKMPTGPKLMKFGTTEVTMKRSPSGASRQRTVVVTSWGLCVSRLIRW